MREIKVGDKIRLKTKLIGGWIGKGTVLYQDREDVTFRRDGYPSDDKCICGIEECSKVRLN